MRTIKKSAAAICFLLLMTCSTSLMAQCSMCTLNAESSVQNGNTEGNGLNNGIMYLLAMPYIAVAAVGFIWYKKYRRKDILLDIKDEKIHLN